MCEQSDTTSDTTSAFCHNLFPTTQLGKVVSEGPGCVRGSVRNLAPMLTSTFVSSVGCGGCVGQFRAQTGDGQSSAPCSARPVPIARSPMRKEGKQELACVHDFGIRPLRIGSAERGMILQCDGCHGFAYLYQCGEPACRMLHMYNPPANECGPDNPDRMANIKTLLGPSAFERGLIPGDSYLMFIPPIKGRPS